VAIGGHPLASQLLVVGASAVHRSHAAIDWTGAEPNTAITDRRARVEADPTVAKPYPPVKTNTPVAIRRTCVEADAPVPVASKGWAGAIDDPTIAEGRTGAVHHSAICPRRAVDHPPHHDWGRAVHDPPHDDGGGSRLIDDRCRRHGGIAVIIITVAPAVSRTAGQTTHKSACRETSPKAAPPPATWAVVSTVVAAIATVDGQSSETAVAEPTIDEAVAAEAAEAAMRATPATKPATPPILGLSGVHGC
jgi:hypothetical protein